MAEIYQGTKFNYKSIGKTISKSGLLPELKKWCAFFKEKRLAPEYPGGSSGNLSFRTESGFIITASSTALKYSMNNTDFTEVIDYFKEENLITGKGKKIPSSESIMHFLIYKNRPDINAVFHGHSHEIMENADKLSLPVTKREFPYGTFELAKDALNLLKDFNFIILKNHGFVSTGKTMLETGKQIEYFLNKCKSIR